MNTEKVQVVETIYVQTSERVEGLFGEGLKVTANITNQNGTVTAIDNLTVRDMQNSTPAPEWDPASTEHGVLWSGSANPYIYGQFRCDCQQVEVMSAIVEFINAVKGNN